MLDAYFLYVLMVNLLLFTVLTTACGACLMRFFAEGAEDPPILETKAAVNFLVIQISAIAIFLIWHLILFPSYLYTHADSPQYLEVGNVLQYISEIVWMAGFFLPRRKRRAPGR